MKSLKLLAAACIMFAAGTLMASGDADYGMFKNVPNGIETQSVFGVRFGLPCAISSGIVEGAELSLLQCNPRCLRFQVCPDRCYQRRKSRRSCPQLCQHRPERAGRRPDRPLQQIRQRRHPDRPCQCLRQQCKIPVRLAELQPLRLAYRYALC